MLTRLAHLLRAEVVGFTATEDLVDLVEDGREGIRLLLIHFCLGDKIYSLLWRRVTLSQIICSSQTVLYTKVSRYLGGDMSLSFSEAGSPPMPQCVFGIS